MPSMQLTEQNTMRKYLLIGLGSFLGAVLRYTLKELTLRCLDSGFPLSTLLINLCGAFLLSFILNIALNRLKLSEAVKLSITVGLLGAFTTFSTLCKETALLMYANSYFTALIYVTASAILGLCFAWLGFWAAERVNKLPHKSA